MAKHSVMYRSPSRSLVFVPAPARPVAPRCFRDAGENVLLDDLMGLEPPA